MAFIDNPAGRLAAVLDQVRNANPHAAALDEWTRILGAMNRLDTLVRAGELVALTREVEDAVRKLPEEEDPAHLLEYFGQASAAIDGLLYVGNVSMDHFTRQITGEVVYSLNACARALRRNGHREPTIDDDAVTELVNDVRGTIDKITNGNLSPAVQLFLVNRLRDVEKALVSIKITGFADVSTAMDALTAGAFRATDEGEQRNRVMGWVMGLWSQIIARSQEGSLVLGAANQAITAYQTIAGGGTENSTAGQ